MTVNRENTHVPNSLFEAKPIVSQPSKTRYCDLPAYTLDNALNVSISLRYLIHVGPQLPVYRRLLGRTWPRSQYAPAAPAGY